MEVTRYTFQSPYPNQIQIGQVDPSTAQQEKTQQETAELNYDSNSALKRADTYSFEQKSGIKEAVSGTTSSSTSTALANFNDANTHLQALTAYSS